MTFKDRWIEALYSGAYQQSRGSLRKDDTFCCLGVLCDLVDPEGWKKNPFANHYSFKLYNSMPPTDIMVSMGLTYADTTTLSTLNDSSNFSFEEIADYLLHCEMAGVTPQEGYHVNE